ncbi:hypothetical protein KR50_23590 [Jeotgalibacillus campisalis]|uniref:Uncharacterized protein n=1 Tax=Jeotgalibacillus campisalis TaxID=220754 RepID=A0A0C2VDP8_9BACL|nr:hypothetical protein KR50_23590 [Jeotgalibacillus campisalis]
MVVNLYIVTIITLDSKQPPRSIPIFAQSSQIVNNFESNLFK